MRASDQWGLIKELFETARSLPPSERLAYVEANTTGTAREELLSLLESYDSIESTPDGAEFLETPVVLPSADLLTGGWVGKRFGAYEAVSLLGEGGMGSVYEGRRADGAFEQRVAIKVMKQELVSAHLLERFRRERQILASLDHPHIARLLDGGEVEASPWPVPFMVMEFIDGIPITRYTAENRLDGKGCAALVADVCDAVEYAHGHQVIHRDIKPGNALVDRTGRVKLLDFGISKIVSEGSEDDRTATVMRLATPAYASPEQLLGESASAPSDIFSLGAVLYEMISGSRLPREGWKPLGNPALDRIACKACAAKVEERYRSAGEMGADLRRYIGGQRIHAPWTPRRRRITMAAATACVAIAAGAWWRLHQQQHARPVVAVLQLRNLSGKPGAQWVSTAATEVLASELGAGGAVRVVPEELTVRAVRELHIDPADSYSSETLAKLRAYLNADRIVTGSFLSLSDRPADPLRFQFRMQDTRSSAIVAPVTESASVSELSAMATRASGRFREALGAVPATGKAREANPDALRYYADGLNYQRSFDFPRARESFEQAVAIDPGFAMAHFRLSEVFRTLGKMSQARTEIDLAGRNAADLRQDERLMIEGYALLRGPADQRTQSIAKFQQLVAMDPSSVDWTLLLGNAQLQVNDLQGAQETLRKLRANQEPPDVGRIDAFESDLLSRRADYRGAAQAALHCASVALPAGSQLAAAECLLKAGIADVVIGEHAKGLVPLQQAEAIFTASGNRIRVAAVHNSRAGIFLHQNKIREALAEFQAVADTGRDLEAEGLEAAALNNMGLADTALGEFRAAADAHLQAIALLDKLHDTTNLSYAYVNLATAYMEMGDLKEAARVDNRGLEYARQIGAAPLLANATLSLADIRIWEGRLTEARRICEEALQDFEKTGAKRYIAYTRSMLGEIWFNSGDDEKAAAEYNAALAVAREIHEDDLVGMVAIDQARIDLAQARYAEAERSAHAALAAMSAGNADGKDVLWHMYLAVALAGQGRKAEAEAQRQIVTKGMASIVRPDVRVQLMTAEGWLRIGEKRFEEAAGMLEDASKQAASQMPLARGEAELALGEARFGAGDSNAALQILRTLIARDPGTRAAKLARMRMAHPGPGAVWRPLP